MNGIYGYKDLKTGYVVYVGRDSYIDKKAKKSKEKDLNKFSGRVSSRNKSGFLHVSKEGNSWRYSITKNGKRMRFQKTTLKELRSETKKRGLPWEIVDKEKARKSWGM